MMLAKRDQQDQPSRRHCRAVRIPPSNQSITSMLLQAELFAMREKNGVYMPFDRYQQVRALSAPTRGGG